MNSAEFNDRVEDTFRTDDSEGLKILLEHFRSLPDGEKVELWNVMWKGMENSAEYKMYVHREFARDTVPAFCRHFGLPEVPFGTR